MRVVLDNSKRKEIPINDEIKAITLYLDLEKLRFKNKFDYKIEVGEGLDPSYDEIPSMLIQPYLENAILHGINNKHGKGFINVKLDLEGENIVCRIEDDGVGRKRAAELSKKRSKEHKSQGMSITRDRLSIINRVNESDLSVVVEDIYEGENTGTRVKIYVPFKNF
jgi:LytS/YehU family sensor histidine kinase